MNQTDENFQHDIRTILVRLTVINSTFTLIVCTILYYPVFPIYIYVFRKNRDKEKDSNVFPILNHFYRTTIFDWFCKSILLIAQLCQYLNPGYVIKNPVLVWIITQWGDFFLVYYEIHHLIIVLLAVQRFILYFELPVKADFSPKAINVILVLLYFVGYLKLAVFEILIFVLKNEMLHFVYVKMIQYESIVIHILLFASAILYIPISVSIRRKAHLRSIIKNKPDRFILLQTIGLAAFKVTSLRLHIYYPFGEGNRESKFYGNTHDFYTTPVLIQMSYLFSNKRNIDTIKNISKRNNRTTPSSSVGAARALSVDT